MWCVVGDFNTVKCASEKRGSSWGNIKAESNALQDFIDDLNLIDLPVLGNRFTWFKHDGTAMSRLDRFLLSEEWINLWGFGAQWIGKRDVSDHCPIMLKGKHTNWGPKPFRFNNCWLQHPGFKKFVVNCWSNFRIEGWKIHGFKEKLRRLKECLKVWNIEVYGNLDTRIKQLVVQLNESDELAASIELNED